LASLHAALPRTQNSLSVSELQQPNFQVNKIDVNSSD